MMHEKVWWQDEATGIGVGCESGCVDAGRAYASGEWCDYRQSGGPFWVWGVHAQRQAYPVLHVSWERCGFKQK